MTVNEHEPKKTDDYLEAMRKFAEEQNQKRQHFGGGACPSCGHCPHCGRGGRQAYPFYPSSPPWTGGTSTTSGGLSGVTGPYFFAGGPYDTGIRSIGG